MIGAGHAGASGGGPLSSIHRVTRDSFWSTAIKDPDGNLIEFTQLRDEWFTMLEARRGEGADVVSRWRATKR